MNFNEASRSGVSAIAQRAALATECINMEYELERRFSRVIPEPAEIVFEFTKDKALLKQYYEIRARMFGSIGMPSVFSADESDDDAKSDIIVMKQGRMCMGGGRILLKSPRRVFQTPIQRCGIDVETLFPEMKLAYTPYMEMGAVARLPQCRDVEFLDGLFSAVVRRAVAEGVRHIFFISSMQSARIYQWGARKHPGHIDMFKHIVPDSMEPFDGVPHFLSLITLDEALFEEGAYLTDQNKKLMVTEN